MSPENGRIIFDMSDLVSFFLVHSHPTGIQRTQIDVFLKMRSTGTDVVPVFFSRVYNCYCRLDADRLFAADRPYLRGFDGRIGRPLVRLRIAASLFNKRIRLGRGDHVFVAGAGWANPRRSRLLAASRDAGIRITWMCYDLIPVRRPEFSAHPTLEYDGYKSWIDEAIRHRGRFICISQFVADDLKSYAADLGFEVEAHVVPLAHEFRTAEASNGGQLVPQGAVGQLRHEKFVLCVGAVTYRKNQFALARLWERLQREHDEDMPVLVLVGPTWGMDRLFKYLDANGYLAGKLIHLSNASDVDLSFLYQHCEFTVLPSLYEGWGLPVGESLWMGKPCLSSNATSLPEVGGEHVTYFDPHRTGDFEDKLRKALAGQFAALPPSRDKLRTWAEVGRDIAAVLA